LDPRGRAVDLRASLVLLYEYVFSEFSGLCVFAIFVYTPDATFLRPTLRYRYSNLLRQTEECLQLYGVILRYKIVLRVIFESVFEVWWIPGGGHDSL